MKRLLFILPLTVFMLLSCEKMEPSALDQLALIPMPVDIENTGEYFKISDKTRVVYSWDSDKIPLAAQLVSRQVSTFSTSVEINSQNSVPAKGIVFEMVTKTDMSPEWYQLEITRKRVVIKATTDEGAFRGAQTLVQLIDLMSINSGDGQQLLIPTGVITDFPEFEYRGAMLDVARHFFDMETVKAYIDRISKYKLNVLHLHLSDDQGWRIEIKSWPKLTEIGGSTEVGGGKGGFYTQEEFKELVAYADSRFISIVPEIDMPGHTNAALASYAELNCDKKATELYIGTKVGFSTLCTAEEITYQFVEDVVREISEMITGSYFHLGGDESHVTDLPDYIYFINRVRKIVKDQGKTMIGWDEVSHAEISKGDVAQYWSSAENAERAIAKGSKILLSPAKYCYLDMQYDSTSPLGLHWAAYIEVDQAYNWKPLDLVEGITRTDILGIESPLWGETIESMDDIDYLTFPRLLGHAELGWSKATGLSWKEYKSRLTVHGKLLEKSGVNFYRSPLIEWE